MRLFLGRLLGGRRFPVVVALVAMALLLPTLGAGLASDDLLQCLLFRREFRWPGGIRGDWDIFRFQGPDRGALHHLMDLGILPWWTAPHFRCAFLRPLSSLLHAIDYRFLAGAPWVMHAESIALYGAVVLVAATFYRRLIAPAWAAGLALFFFAVDDAHSTVAAWLANRNALVAALFGFGALVLHDYARRDRDRRAAMVAPALFALALLGGEVATGTLAYLFAYALFLDEAPWRQRLGALVPYALITLAWMVAYKGLGYGAVGGEWYIDPGSEPLAFARAAVLRLPMLLLAQLAGPPAMVWMLVPHERLSAALAAGGAALALLLTVLVRVLGRDRRARFFAVGAVLSLVPMCATWPQDRNLLFCGLGAFGVVALFFARLGRLAGSSLRPWALVTAGLFVLAHAVAGPLLLPVRAYWFAQGFHEYVDSADRALPKTTSDSVLIMVNAPDTLVNTYVAAMRVLRGEPMPRAMRQLAHALAGNDGELERLDERTVAVTLQKGFLDDADLLGRLVRSANIPFRQGDVVRLDGMTATVVSITADGRPQRMQFQFERPLEDPSYRWVTWEKTGCVPTKPPAVGAKVKIASIDY
jgi:hypothetical protein